MKKVIVISFFFAVLCNIASFANQVTPEPSLVPQQTIGKFVYFRVYLFENQTYYFSNILWVEGKTGSDYVNNLDAKKDHFKKMLKELYNINWTAPVQNYTDNNEDSMTADRLTRIKQAGEKWENIEL